MEAPLTRGDKDRGIDAAGEPTAAFSRQVRNALSHLYDVPYLQTHPLASVAAREPGVRASAAGKALQMALTAAIEDLRPAAGSSSTSRGHRGHQLLAQRFVEGSAIVVVAGELGISQTEYYREQHRAVAGVVSMLWQRWESAWRQGNAVPQPIVFESVSQQRETNLPVALTGFVGREREVAAVLRILETARLLTITGPGGYGKTRLAIETIRRIPDRYPDGIWFVDFAGLADPALAADVIAGVLGCVGSHGSSSLQAVSRMLARRRALLLLDNCERLVGACAELVEALLQSCPHLAILVTSRERLRIPGESIFVVPPLESPPSSHITTVEATAGYDAVRLFVDRAVEVDSSFALAPHNVRAVSEICQRLDGNPLALELAAARLRALPISELLSRLVDQFQVLTTGSRTAQRRHQSLSGMVEWSYDLLENDERALFDRLSVFAAGWSLDAAESVCAGGPVERGRVLEVLARLIDKSLVVFVGTDALGERYRLLETLREYGRAKLALSGDADVTLDRHAGYYLSLAERAAPDLVGPDQNEWVPKLALDQDNFRQAFRRLVDRDRPLDALRLAGALWRFWAIRGQCGEGRRLLGETLEGARAAATDEQTSSWVAQGLLGSGALALMQGDYGRSKSALAESVDLFRALGDQRGVAWSLIYLCWARIDSGDTEGARPLLEEARAAAQTSGDRTAEAWALGMATLEAHFTSDLERGREIGAQAIGLYQRAGDRWGAAWAKHLLAAILNNSNWPDRGYVETLQAESVAAWRELGSRRDLAYSLYSVAHHLNKTGRAPSAEPILREALPISLEISDLFGVVTGLLHWATQLRMTGVDEPAMKLVGAVLAAQDAGALALTPLYGAWCDRLRRGAEAAIGAEATESAVSAGRAISLDEAVEYVLGR